MGMLLLLLQSISYSDINSNSDIKNFGYELYNFRNNQEIHKEIFKSYKDKICLNKTELYDEKKMLKVFVNDDKIVFEFEDKGYKEEYKDNYIHKNYTEDKKMNIIQFIKNKIRNNFEVKDNLIIKIDFSGVKNPQDKLDYENLFLKEDELENKITILEIKESMMYCYDECYKSGQLEKIYQYFYSYNEKFYCAFVKIDLKDEKIKISKMVHYLYNKYIKKNLNDNNYDIFRRYNDIQNNKKKEEFLQVSFFKDIVKYNGTIKFLEGLVESKYSDDLEINFIKSLVPLLRKTNIVDSYIEDLSEAEIKDLSSYLKESDIVSVKDVENLYEEEHKVNKIHLSNKLESFLENLSNLKDYKFNLEHTRKFIKFLFSKHAEIIKENEDKILEDNYFQLYQLFNRLLQSLQKKTNSFLICLNIMKEDPELKNSKAKKLFEELSPQLKKLFKDDGEYLEIF